MAFEEIGAPRRRYPVSPAVPADLGSLEIGADVIPIRPAEDEFFCEGCRRDLPETDRSRIVRTRCLACA